MKSQSYAKISLVFAFVISCFIVLYIATTSSAENGGPSTASAAEETINPSVFRYPVVSKDLAYQLQGQSFWTQNTAPYPKGTTGSPAEAYQELSPAIRQFLQENNLSLQQFVQLTQQGFIQVPEKPLATFADVEILKNHPAETAMEKMVSLGELKPFADNKFSPNKAITKLEFLQSSLQWLKKIKGNSKLTPMYDKDELSSLGFEQESELLLEAARYQIPLFGKNSDSYFLPITRIEAAIVTACLAKYGLGEKENTSQLLQEYISDAFSLRNHAYLAEITQTIVDGVWDTSYFQPFYGEKLLTRAEASEVLYRLFEPKYRVVNTKLSVEKLTDATDDYLSQAVCLFNNETKQFIWQKNAEQRLSPASLTKVMTVLVAIEHISDLKEKVYISGAQRQRMLRMHARIAGFKPNEKVSYEELLYATLLSSGAESAGTLAIRLAGSEANFIQWMNEKAAEIGMKNTQFQTVEGLDAIDQYTTAKDMILLLETALKNPTFYQIFTTAEYTTSKNRLHPRGIRLNSTVLGSLNDSEMNGFKIIGGKSGTTFMAGLCWATLAEKNGTPYLLVTLSAPLDNLANPTMTQKEDALKIYHRLP
ncbi:MAG: S-layer homology domain-containing protein [Eubacteriales bacterium]|nr:S-layer homology domain-containing protein [Eubacteriales bacterium]